MFGVATFIMQTTVTLLTWASVLTAAFGQIRFDSAAPVTKTDPIFPLLADHQTAIEAKYERGQRIRASFSNWVEVKAASVAELFPELRFASISWSERDHPASKQHLIGMAHGIDVTLAVNSTTNRVEAELNCGGAYERYGKLLMARAVLLRNEAEAGTIWDAFCEIHHRHWKDRPMKRVSKSEWHLGLFNYDQITSVTDGFKTEVTRTHYMKVITDPTTGQITSWESKMDSSNERKASFK